MPRLPRSGGPIRARAFRTPALFRAWLERNHDRADELTLRLYKVHARDRGIDYKEALDEALCFGWIDGVRRGWDEDSFTVRFTPRRPNSIWSNVNIRRARELASEGRMAPPGLRAFRARDPARSGVYSFESPPVELAPAYEKKMRAIARAWAYYRARPPWYRRTAAFWVMSAKKEETRLRRLETLIAHSAREEPIPPLRRESRS